MRGSKGKMCFLVLIIIAIMMTMIIETVVNNGNKTEETHIGPTNHSKLGWKLVIFSPHIALEESY